MRSGPLSRHLSRGVFAALFVAFLPMAAHAQAYQRIAPREPQTLPSPTVTPPTAPGPSSASHAPIVSALHGLVFLPSMASLQPAGLPSDSAGTDGIRAAGLPLLNDPAFVGQLERFIGHPFSLADLNEIVRLTTQQYRAHGAPFVAVVTPPQNVSSGVIQVVVTEYRVGTARVAGANWFSDDMLLQESGLTSGQTLTLSGVQDDLDWLNSNPFRSVNMLFQPGADPGTTDVVLQTQDRMPFRVYAGFDNQGVPSLGRGEWNVGAVWGDAFGQDQTISYQFTKGFTGRYDASALSWTDPLAWRDKLLIFGSYATETPDLGRTFKERGKSGQASIRYVHTLPRLALADDLSLTENLQIGYDFKTTNNNLEFGGTRVFAAHAVTSQFPLIYDATLNGTYGQTAFENQLVISPGGMLGNNTTRSFDIIVPGATAGYVYDRIGVTQTTFLPAAFSWSARATAQFSNRNLLYSEQLGAGGMNSVRGYYTDTAIGSRGVLVSQEIRTPAFSLGGPSLPVSDREQLGVFWDYGHVDQVQKIPNSVNAADLSSFGVDLHATLDRYADLTFDLGKQLRSAPGSNKHSLFGDVALIIGF